MNDYCIVIDNGEMKRKIEAGSDYNGALKAWQSFVDRGSCFRVTLIELDVDGDYLAADWQKGERPRHSFIRTKW